MKILILILTVSTAPLTAICQWNTSNSPHIYYNSGKVGVGTASPSFDLDVVGNLRTSSHINANQYIVVEKGGSYVVAMNGQSDGYVTGKNALYQDRFLINSNGNSYFNGGNVGIGTAVPGAALDVVGNFRVSNVGTFNGLRLGRYGSVLAGDANPYIVFTDDSQTHDVTLYGESNAILNLRMFDGDLKMGASTSPNAVLYNDGRLSINAGNNTEWAASIFNTGGSGKGLRVRGASADVTPVLQVEDNYGANRFMVRSDGRVAIGTTTPKHNLHIKGRMYLEGTESYPSGWLQNYFHWRGHSLIMGSEIGEYAHNTIELKAGGSNSGLLYTHFQMYDSPSPDNHVLKVHLASNGVSYFNGGNVGIGTATPDAALAVKGHIHTQEVRVDLSGAVAPDYVFENDYQLLPLSEVKSYVKANKHLPEVPSAKQMEEQGLNLREMNLILLKKVEELTLHLIAQQEALAEKSDHISELEQRVKSLEIKIAAKEE